MLSHSKRINLLAKDVVQSIKILKPVAGVTMNLFLQDFHIGALRIVRRNVKSRDGEASTRELRSITALKKGKRNLLNRLTKFYLWKHLI